MKMIEIENRYLGFWGNISATIDWCEANYEVSYYLAEFWNTVSNVVMVILGVAGILYAIKNPKLCHEPRYMYCCVALARVGSSLFHGMLLYEVQLMDELPMLYGTAGLIYSMKEVSSAKRVVNYKLIIQLIIYTSIATVLYVALVDHLYFLVLYGIMTFYCVYLGVHIVRTYEHSSFLARASLFLYLAGLIIWNIDYTFCNQIKFVRHSIGYPLKPLLQGHAWWHCLAGSGAYMTVLFVTDARTSYMKRTSKIEMKMGCVPVITVV